MIKRLIKLANDLDSKGLVREADVIDAFLKSHPKFFIESAKDYVPEEYVDEKGALFTYPPEHQIDGGFAVRLKNG